MILDHPFDIQIFKGNESEHGYKSTAELVREVAATIGNAFVDAPRRFALLFSLRLRKCFLIRAKESRVSNLFTCRERPERRKSNVNSDASVTLWQGSRFDFHREARIPLARRRAGYR